MKLSEYVLLPAEERRKHVDLTTPCTHDRVHLRRKKLCDLLGLEDDLGFLKKLNLCQRSLCDSVEEEKRTCANPRHSWFTYWNEPRETATRVWVSLFDGFVASAGLVVAHNRAVGQPDDARVRLTPAEHAELHSLYENFRLTTEDGRRRRGLRLPREHWPERVKKLAEAFQKPET
jgi:hypothetical protein